MARRRGFTASAAAALLLAACVAPVPEGALPTKGAPGAENLPRIAYEQAAARGDQVYRVDPLRSLVAITVRRGGSLARLGHDHVIASRSVQGYMAEQAQIADLLVPLGELTVDEPDLRREAGLDTQPSESDVAATRGNLFDKVLDVRRFPLARIHIARPAPNSAPAPANLFSMSLTLAGTTRSFMIPVRIDIGRDELDARGTLAFNQSDFGIVPFAILGGAIQVQDQLELRFRIVADRGLDH